MLVIQKGGTKNCVQAHLFQLIFSLLKFKMPSYGGIFTCKFDDLPPIEVV